MDAIAKVGISCTHCKVSRLGFGGVPLGGLYKDVSEDEAGATVRRALDLGINYFDTAPTRMDRKAKFGWEENWPTAIANRLSSPPRLDTPSFPTTGPATRRYFIASTTCPRCVLVFDLSYDGIMRTFEGSLHRLNLAHVDILKIPRSG